MKFIQPNPEIAPDGLRAMIMIAQAPRGGIAKSQRRLLEIKRFKASDKSHPKKLCQEYYYFI